MTSYIGLDRRMFEYLGIGRSAERPYRIGIGKDMEAYKDADGIWHTRPGGRERWAHLVKGRDAFRKLAAKLDAREKAMFMPPKTDAADEDGRR